MEAASAKKNKNTPPHETFLNQSQSHPIMARLRKFSAYQKIERPYTRISKFKKHSYIKGRPHTTLVRFEMGSPNGKFDTTLFLVSKTDTQIRHNALESARQTSNRVFEKTIGKTNYFLKIRKFPHHILRENPMATGAGADRMSQGMKLAFGKPISNAAQVFVGEILMEARVNHNDLKIAKLGLMRAQKKLPGSYRIIDKKDFKKTSSPTKQVVSSKPVKKSPKISE
jgi:large subunit ribosomal protein L10e